MWYTTPIRLSFREVNLDFIHTYHQLLMHPKDLSNVGKNTLDILIVNDGPTPLSWVLQRLFEDLDKIY